MGLVVGDGKSSVDKNVTAVDAHRENRWGYFMEGNGEFVHANGDPNAAGYNFTTGGVTLGADYRFNDHLVVGLMAGYANTGATQINNGSVEANGGRFGLLSTFYGRGMYLNIMAAGGYNSYNTHRLGLGGIAGSTNGTEFDGLLSWGYEAHQGHLTFGPIASLQYTRVGIDGFNEAGSLAPLNVPSQNQGSLRSKVGFRISYDWDVRGITVTPAISAAWQHEYLDSAFALDSQFANGAGNTFTVNGPAFGRDSVVVNAGVAGTRASVLSLLRRGIGPQKLPAQLRDRRSEGEHRSAATALGAISASNSRAVFWIWNLFVKQSVAAFLIASRPPSFICVHCSSSASVPAASSGCTIPPPSSAISRQMFTLSEISTGSPQASASTTAMPKFSWCEGSMNTSAPRNAPHLISPASVPGNEIDPGGQCASASRMSDCR